MGHGCDMDVNGDPHVDSAIGRAEQQTETLDRECPERISRILLSRTGYISDDNPLFMPAVRTGLCSV